MTNGALWDGFLIELLVRGRYVNEDLEQPIPELDISSLERIKSKLRFSAAVRFVTNLTRSGSSESGRNQ